MVSFISSLFSVHKDSRLLPRPTWTAPTWRAFHYTKYSMRLTNKHQNIVIIPIRTNLRIDSFSGDFYGHFLGSFFLVCFELASSGAFS
jgi:hypothetical protein